MTHFTYGCSKFIHEGRKICERWIFLSNHIHIEDFQLVENEKEKDRGGAGVKKLKEEQIRRPHINNGNIFIMIL